mgnify:CR=1 FL=1
MFWCVRSLNKRNKKTLSANLPQNFHWIKQRSTPYLFMTQATLILHHTHKDNRFVTFSTTETKFQHPSEQSNDQTESLSQNQNVDNKNREECLFTTLLCSDILIELLLNCTPQISAYMINKEITALLTQTGDKFAQKACKRKWGDVVLENYAVRSWKECFWIVE